QGDRDAARRLVHVRAGIGVAGRRARDLRRACRRRADLAAARNVGLRLRPGVRAQRLRPDFCRTRSRGKAPHQPPGRCVREACGGPVRLERRLAEPIPGWPVATDEEIVARAARHRAADLARAAPDDLRIVADVLPVARARDVREPAVPVMLPLADERADHVLDGEIAGRTHPQVLPGAAILALRIVAMPAFARQFLRPGFCLAGKIGVPGETRYARTITLAVMLCQHALGEAIVE